MFLSIGEQGKNGFITTKRLESGDSGMLIEDLRGGGDYGGTYSYDCEVSLRPKVLACLGGGGRLIGRR